jgi:hypothetical protein
MWKKYGGTRQAKDKQYDTAHAHCVLDKWRYRHIMRMCSITFPRQQWLSERSLCYVLICSQSCLCLRSVLLQVFRYISRLSHGATQQIYTTFDEGPTRAKILFSAVTFTASTLAGQCFSHCASRFAAGPRSIRSV